MPTSYSGRRYRDPSSTRTEVDSHFDRDTQSYDYPSVDIPWFQTFAMDPRNQIQPTGNLGFADPNVRTYTHRGVRYAGPEGREAAIGERYSDSGQYQTSAAVRPLGSVQQWRADPYLSNLARSIPQMLGFDRDRNQYDMSKGSLLGGPGQAFSPGQLASLYAQGQQNLNQQQQAQNAGIANAFAGRGATGPSMSALFGASNQAANRGALAQGNLNAQMQGLQMGVQQHQGRLGAFNQVSNLADRQAAQNMDAQKLDFLDRQQDRQYAQERAAESEQAVNDFMNRYAIQLTSKPGSEHEDDVLANLRKQLEDLQVRASLHRDNLTRYYGRG